MLQTLNKFYGFIVINYIDEIWYNNNNIILSEKLCDKLVEKLYENYNETQIAKNNIPIKQKMKLKNPALKFNKENFAANENNLILIYLIIENKKIKSLEGHKHDVNIIRYYLDEKNNNEYLMSKDEDRGVIIQNISKNYVIYSKQRILLYASSYSSTLFFPLYKEQNYFISSLYSNGVEEVKIYKLENQELIGTFGSQSNSPNYLLTWYNNSNKKYYIIKFSFEKIRINNLFEGELYIQFTELNKDFIPGFIQTKNNIDYLYAFSSRIALIGIWDLNNKICFKKISFRLPCRKITRGNLNYCLVLTNKFIDVLELNNYYVIQSFKKAPCYDSEQNNIIKFSNNDGKEFLIDVENNLNYGMIIKLIDY